MLIGEFKSTIGEKKRVAIPKKIREQMEGELILTRGYEECLVLIDQTRWERIATDVAQGSFINQNIRETSRFLVGSAVQLELDTQGRTVIPQPLYEHAQLQKEVVFVGLINWVEVWDIEKWEKKLNYLKENSSQIAQELALQSSQKNGSN